MSLRKFYEKYEYGAYNPRFSFFAKGGKMKRDWSTYYNNGGMVQ